MASKWETSPRMRKMFMVPGKLLWGEGTGALSAGRDGEGGEFFSAEPRLNERSPSVQLSFSLSTEPFLLVAQSSVSPLPGLQMPFPCQAGCLPCLLFHRGGFCLSQPRAFLSAWGWKFGVCVPESSPGRAAPKPVLGDGDVAPAWPGWRERRRQRRE